MKTKLSFRISIIVMLIITLNFTAGCTHYSANLLREAVKNAAPFRKGEPTGKRNYVIAVNNGEKYKLTDITVKPGFIFCTTAHLTEPEYESLKTKDADTLVNTEVYFYLNKNFTFDGKTDTISETYIDRIELVDIHDGKPAKVFFADQGMHPVFIFLLVLLGLFLIAIIITKIECGCPFVYQFDGSTYTLSGEAFSGATFPSLERQDHILLENIQPVNGNYTLKIANKLQEQQYTDLAQLLIVKHPPDAKVYVTKEGRLISTQSEIPAQKVFATGEIDYTMSMEKKDGNLYTFSEAGESYEPSVLYLEFVKPENADSGKFVINGGNSVWGDYVYDQFYRLFGNKFNAWNDKQAGTPEKKLTAWMHDQYIPLAVSVETKNGWKKADFFYPTGAYATKDMALYLDLSDVPDKSKVNLKLETGFQFWNIDYAAMDYSENVPMQKQYIAPQKAVNTDGSDVHEDLAAADGKYLQHMQSGDEVIITYPATESADNMSQTVFLQTEGYYKQIRNFEGEPDIKTLRTFRKPGRLSLFSMEMYIEMQKMLYSEN